MMLINGLEKKFYVVLDPMPDRVSPKFLAEDMSLEDIWYETDYTGLMMLSRGGLDPLDIMGIFKGKRASKAFAKKALAEVRKVVKK